MLPEFQREYVWSLEQAKQLMISLSREYPVGVLLLWKTENPPELKNIKALPEKIGTVQVLLDGQQRLTTLHMLIIGEIPCYYTENEIENDPRNLYVNIRNLDFQYYQPSRMKDDSYWQQVTDCFEDSNEISPIQIAQEKAEDGQDPMELAQLLMDNLNSIRRIKDVNLPELMVPSSANLDEAIDIFDRVNRQGTHLTDAELALTHMTGKWPAARRELKAKMESCNDQGFDFGLTFMTRALTTTVTNRALFELIHSRPREELKYGWDKLSKILDYLLTILPLKMFIHSTYDLSTSNALIPLIVYLSMNNGQFPNEKSIRHASHWLYAALMWSRYTAQTDQRLEADVQLVVRETEPWEALRGNIIEQRGRIEVKALDFEGRGSQNPLYTAAYILAKAHQAVDWFNGLPLGQTRDDGFYDIHIFPQSRLYKNGWSPENRIQRQAVNEIANRAFLAEPASIKNKLPEEYLPKIEENYPGALSAQFVPMDPSLWTVENYKDFLAIRRKTIARKLNEFMDSLISDHDPTFFRPITDIVQHGESYVLEFKSTLQWDIVKNEQNKALRLSVIKTIAAFLNSQGGTLVIGVEDDGSVLGLDRDLALVNQSRDRFERLLVDLISESIGVAIVQCYRIRFEDVEDKSVCIIDVERSPEPVFVKESGKEKMFYIRAGNTSRCLDSEETHKYIEMHW